VFKGSLAVVPATLRRVMMATYHETHIGLEGCIRRAREYFFWPRMTTELKEYISKWETCIMHRPAPQRGTMMTHEFMVEGGCGFV
jgi:predicted Fe-S protein YdhL (DUF1289 family)